jgi:hypothetical protein
MRMVISRSYLPSQRLRAGVRATERDYGIVLHEVIQVPDKQKGRN